MRKFAPVLVGSAVLLVGFAASAKKPEPPDDSAIITGGAICSETGAGVHLEFLAGNTPFTGPSGGVIGVQGTGMSLIVERPGTCAEALAALTAQLPTPLCRTAPSPYLPGGFSFVCSGGARSVVEAVGELAKSVLGP